MSALWLDSNAIHTIENLDNLRELQATRNPNSSTPTPTAADADSSLNRSSTSARTPCETSLGWSTLLASRESMCPPISSRELIETHRTGNTQPDPLLCWDRELPELHPLSRLQTFLCSHCSIKSVKDIQTLADLPLLRTVDFSHNKLGAPMKGPGGETVVEDPITVLAMFEAIPALTNLNLEGNPCTNPPEWRMAAVSRLPRLEILDGLPVTEADRRGATSWSKDITSAFGLPVWQWKFTENVTGGRPRW